MISALLFLQFHSVRNRTLMRIKRLRQPKYLAGFIVGALYFYFYFFRYLFHGGRQGFTFNLTPDNMLLFELFGALALMVIVLVAWVVPHQRTALTFTEAEIAFLFPAPITRRGLVHFKLIRSQTAILVTTLVLLLVTNRFGGHAWIRSAGYWLILSTLNLHLLGSSFALTRLLDRGITNGQRRLAILLVVLLAGAAVVLWARHSLPPLDIGRLQDSGAVAQYAQQVLTSGPMPYLLYPFRLVIRPCLAPNATAFFWALPPALLLLILHYAWVVRSDIAFEEASLEASKRLAEKVAAMRAGNWQATRTQPKRKRAPFRLRPTGPVWVGLLWKNLISAGQAFTLRIWISLAFSGIFAGVVFGQSSAGAGLRTGVGVIAAMLTAWSLLIGPHFLRQDFRQDLPMADLLKTYPLRDWQLVLGELLGPAAVLTGIQWFLLILVAGFFPLPQEGEFTRPMVLGLCLGAAIISPLLNLITLQIPNAAVLLFPAWFQATRGGAHGIEATGQRLIFVLGQFFVLLLALVPAAVAFSTVFFLVKWAAGVAVALPLAAIAADLLLAAEAAAGVMLLGWLFRRFDVSAEQAP